LIALLAPLRSRLDDFRKDPAELDSILEAGAGRARQMGAPVLAQAYRAVGLTR
jgi:tryptophanyl-tRNA synthetase